MAKTQDAIVYGKDKSLLALPLDHARSKDVDLVSRFAKTFEVEREVFEVVKEFGAPARPTRMVASPLFVGPESGMQRPFVGKVRDLRIHVEGAIRDNCHEHMADAFAHYALDMHDLSHRIVEQLLELAVERVHNSDREPKDAAWSVVRELVDTKELRVL